MGYGVPMPALDPNIQLPSSNFHWDFSQVPKYNSSPNKLIPSSVNIPLPTRCPRQKSGPRP